MLTLDLRFLWIFDINRLVTVYFIVFAIVIVIVVVFLFLFVFVIVIVITSFSSALKPSMIFSTVEALVSEYPGDEKKLSVTGAANLIIKTVNGTGDGRLRELMI